MAVYTIVPEADLQRFLTNYNIGGLQDFEEIAEGVENTNYFVTTDKGKFVLTLFEKRVDEKDLPFFLGLMAHFANQGLRAPSPVPAKSGAVISSLCERPAIIVTFLSGRPRMAPSSDDCREGGALLAKMHDAASGFSLKRKNVLDIDGWRALAAKCADRADDCAPGLANQISRELIYLEKHWPENLPDGAVHADLFPDNVFFDTTGAISGIIDFYFACTESFAYDLAITLNAWAGVKGQWSQDNASALLEGYNAIRPLDSVEMAALPVLLRGSALRFLLTRLHDWIYQVDDAIVNVKDPLEYLALLKTHQKFIEDAMPGANMIEIYTDGACSGNPGPGGWGVLILADGDDQELCGGEPDTTNNRMEMMAAIEALRATKGKGPVRLITDSQYVKNGITQWMAGWKRNGWRTAAKKPVKNKDLWEALDAQCQGREIEWRWVKGHDGDAGNERADALARAGIEPCAE